MRRPSDSASQRSRPAVAVLLGVEGGRGDHEAGDALGVVEREPHGGVRAHRRAGQHRALDPAVVEHGAQVLDEVVVVVGVRVRRRARGAVPARVVGDDAVARALERARAHDDVAARRGQPVQEHDGDPLPRLLAGERHAAGLHA